MTTKSRLLALIALSFTVLSLPGCGGSNNNRGAPPPPYYPQGHNTVCSPGMVYSPQHGCLPQGSCPTGQAWNGTTCVVAMENPPTTGHNSCAGSCQVDQVMTQHGCLPQYTCEPCSGYLNRRCYPGAVQMNDDVGSDNPSDGDYGSTPAPGNGNNSNNGNNGNFGSKTGNYGSNAGNANNGNNGNIGKSNQGKPTQGSKPTKY